MPKTELINDLHGDIRMTLVRDEFINDLPPRRFKAGTVVMVNQTTADRWERFNIAVPSAETDQTAADQKRAQLAALQAEIEALESHEAINTSGAVQTLPRRGRPRG